MMASLSFEKSRPKVRLVRAALIGLDGEIRSTITMVVDDAMPEIVMFNGDPFLYDPSHSVIAYLQVRPFRADIGE